jgi:hypothetical protein
MLKKGKEKNKTTQTAKTKPNFSQSKLRNSSTKQTQAQAVFSS